MSALERRAADIRLLAWDVQEDETVVGSILLDLADHLSDTAGDLTEKAVDEIAYAFLEGAYTASASHYSMLDVRNAQKLANKALTAIGRVS